MATAASKDRKRITYRRISSIRVASVNSKVYRPVSADDPEVRSLADSIREHGVLEPLVISEDGRLLSGHRRLVAAPLAGLTMVPVRIAKVNQEKEPEKFLRMLVAFNKQRLKSFEEKVRESVIEVDPEQAHQALRAYRASKVRPNIDTLYIRDDVRQRTPISSAKMPFLEAAKKVIMSRQGFWPLSLRAVHYLLISLSEVVLMHAGKPASVYENTLRCYKQLSDLLTRARVQRLLPWDCLCDETRRTMEWDVYRDVGAFLDNEMERFLRDYWRDLQQGQGVHVEILAEKLTVAPILESVAEEFTIPVMTGRGYASLPLRYELVQRLKRSGCDRLVVLMVSDFDPDGEEICESFVRSLRRDFQLRAEGIKVALTREQVEQFKLPPRMKAKQTKRARRFVDKYGEDVWEVEALQPEVLQQLLRDAICSTIDLSVFERELQQEREDAANLERIRTRVQVALGGVLQGE